MQFVTCRSFIQRRVIQQHSSLVAVSSLHLMSQQKQFSSCCCSNTTMIGRFSAAMTTASASSATTSNNCSAVIPSCTTSIRTAIQEVRAGDWLCANCGENNFRFRTTCNLCSKPRSGPSGGANGQTIGDVLSTPPTGLETSSSTSNSASSSSAAGGAAALDRSGRQHQKQPHERNIGDWQCPVCQCLNFKFRSECFSCREARPASERPPKGMELTEANMKPGDWKCTECAAINFRGRTACFTCRCARSPAAMTAGGVSGAGVRRTTSMAHGGTDSFRKRGGGSGGSGGGASGSTRMKPGDWICLSCSEMNFADRAACFRCNSPRGDARGYQPSGAPAHRTSHGVGDAVMEGDWMCPGCGTNNFRRRIDCVKCKMAKPPRAPREQPATPAEQSQAKNTNEKPEDPVDDL